MSADVLTAIISVATLLVAMAGASGWMIHRMDLLADKIDAVDVKLTEKIEAFDANLTGKIEAFETKLTDKIEAVGTEVTEVKIAVARLEGPPRRLLPVR